MHYVKTQLRRHERRRNEKTLLNVDSKRGGFFLLVLHIAGQPKLIATVVPNHMYTCIEVVHARFDFFRLPKQVLV